MSSFEVVNGVPVVEAAAHGHGTLVVDMTATRFCDSSGLHTLLAVHNRALGEGGELLLVIPDIVRFRVFQITGFDRVIHRVTSLDQALAQTSADGLGAPRRVDGAPHNGDGHGLPAQHGSSELAGEAR